MKKIIFFIIFLGYCTPGNLFAKAEKPANSANVTVRVSGQKFKVAPLYLKVINDNIIGDAGATQLECLPNSNGEYKFNVKNITKLVAFRLAFEKYGFLSGFIHPGDDVIITFNRTGDELKQKDMQFSGRGAYKMDVQWRLCFVKNNAWLRNIAQPDFYNGTFVDTLLKKADSVYISQRKVLLGYRKSLDKKVFGLFDAQLFAEIYLPTLRYFQYGGQSNISAADLSLFYSKLMRIHPYFSSDIACQSNEYISYLVARARAMADLKDRHPSKRFQNIFTEVMTERDVLLREKMLVYFILRDGSSNKSDAPELVYANVLKNLSNPTDRKFVADLSMARQKGVAAYNFTLTDSIGQKVRLSDFKGKVVVIECWFTGCGSCSGLSKLIEKEVMPGFKGKKDLVFVSVCVDRNKEMWMESLREGNYSSPGCINVYTQGLGQNHPFILNYKFKGYPQLLLVDRLGNLVSPNIRGTGSEIAGKISAALEIK